MVAKRNAGARWAWVGLALVGCAHPLLPAPQTAEDSNLCFGGKPEKLLTGEIAPMALGVLGGEIVWQAGPNLRRLAPGARQASNAGKLPDDIRIFDLKQGFGISSISDLFAVDLATGKTKVLWVGHHRIQDMLFFSSLGTDETYVYFAHNSIRNTDDAGFFRVPRDGSTPPQQLATEPLRSHFLVDGGFVYWDVSRPPLEAEGIFRRALSVESPVEELSREEHLSYGDAMLRVHQGRLYFVRRGSIASLPVDGSDMVRTAVVTGDAVIKDYLVEGACIYWRTGAAAIMRARLDGGAPEVISRVTPEDERLQRIGDPRRYDRSLASDGRFLYWADQAAGTIFRAGRSASVR